MKVHHPRVACVVLSIDIGEGTGLRPGQLDGAAAVWLEFCHLHGLAATWVASDVPCDGWLAGIATRRGPHELAVRAAGEWLTDAAPRADFSRELSGRLARFRAAGCDATTIFVDGDAGLPHPELVARHGVRAVCPDRITRVRRSPSTERGNQALDPNRLNRVRWGLWEVPAAIVYPASSVREIRGVWRGALSKASTLHVRVDLPKLVAAGRRATKRLDALLTNMVEARDAGDAAIGSVAECIATEERRHISQPARSILRAA